MIIERLRPNASVEQHQVIELRDILGQFVNYVPLLKLEALNLKIIEYRSVYHERTVPVINDEIKLPKGCTKYPMLPVFFSMKNISELNQIY